jgi:hypothetical protein
VSRPPKSNGDVELSQVKDESKEDKEAKGSDDAGSVGCPSWRRPQVIESEDALL